MNNPSIRCYSSRLILLSCLLVQAVVLILIHSSAAAREFNPQGWRKPDVFGARRYSDKTVDLDYNIPGEETRVEKFRTPKGGRIFRYSHAGNIFSYEVDHDLKEPMDYEIVDFDGDGVFEIMQSPYDEYSLPPWTYDY